MPRCSIHPLYYAHALVHTTTQRPLHRTHDHQGRLTSAHPTFRPDEATGGVVRPSSDPPSRGTAAPPFRRRPGHSLAHRPFFRRPTTVRVGGSAARRPVITTSASDEASGHHHRPPSVLRWCSSPGVHPRGDISIHKGIYRSTCK